MMNIRMSLVLVGLLGLAVASGVSPISLWTRPLYSRSIHATKASLSSSSVAIRDNFTSAMKADFASRLKASILP